MNDRLLISQRTVVWVLLEVKIYEIYTFVYNTVTPLDHEYLGMCFLLERKFLEKRRF